MSERQHAELVREQLRTLSRASGALLAVAASVDDSTANKLSAEKLRRLADDCRASRDEILRLIDGPGAPNGADT